MIQPDIISEPESHEHEWVSLRTLADRDDPQVCTSCQMRRVVKTECAARSPLMADLVDGERLEAQPMPFPTEVDHG